MEEKINVWMKINASYDDEGNLNLSFPQFEDEDDVRVEVIPRE